MASSARDSSDGHGEPEKPAVTSSPHSLSKAVHARRAEYVRARKIKLKIGSWNVAACSGTEKDLGGWFLEGKGVDPNLSGLNLVDDDSQAHIESVGEQEDRRKKKQSTIPRGDEGIMPHGSEIGLYALGLQEIVDLASAKEYLGRVYTDPGPMAKWRKALADALPAGYSLIAEQQLSGLLLLIFASPEVAPTVTSVSTVSVGTGIMGYLGNKGAVSTRIVIGETTRLVFINSHLASGTDPAHLERRCWDVQQILRRTHFDPISWAGVLDDFQEGIGAEDFAFWFGDLNFRLEKLPGDDIRRLLMLHTRGEYDVEQGSRKKIDKELLDDSPIIIRSVESDDESDENEPRPSSTFDNVEDDTSSDTLPDPEDFVQDPSQDPASLQATLDSLLPHDQLRHVKKARKAFHDGWREGPITFLPTYKYDVGSMGMFDSSEKKRAPSWCDRILFRTRRDKLEFDGKLQEEELARIKDEEMKARGIDQAGDDESVLFGYNPDDDGEDNSKDVYDDYDEGEAEIDPQPVVTKESFLDVIHLDMYTSHQRVLSSDHKPLDALFTLEYDAVVPELKSKMQQEIARELDRAENEGRPDITVVVEPSLEVEENSQSHASGSPSIRVPEGVNFGQVAYQQRKTRALTIANTSQVTAKFEFVDRPTMSGEEDRISPSWLKVSFANDDPEENEGQPKSPEREFELQPGDTVNATLETFVDDFSLIQSLNDCSAQLDDVLVLRVTNGRDHFIPGRASWLQSCFGRSIDELIRIPQGGVRALLPNRRNSDGPPINRGQDVCWSAPRELFKLSEALDILTDRVIADANMIEDAQLPTESPGWPFAKNSWLQQDTTEREPLKRYIIEALDSDKPLIDSSPPETPAIQKLEIIAEILIMFLGSLKDGIVTSTLWSQLEQDITTRGAKQLTSSEETKTWVLDVLSTSPNHNISFVFLTSMLSRVAGELAPITKVPISATPSIAESTKGGFDTVRRSLSWKGKPPPLPSDPGVLRRQALEKAYAEVFAPVVFRNAVPAKEKERKVVEERKREILEAFLKGEER